jgi:hypothetical protein
MKTRLGRLIGFCLLLLAGLFANGCKTTDSEDNEASRPWNAPRDWETGLPGFQQNERR